MPTKKEIARAVFKEFMDDVGYEIDLEPIKFVDPPLIDPRKEKEANEVLERIGCKAKVSFDKFVDEFSQAIVVKKVVK